MFQTTSQVKHVEITDFHSMDITNPYMGQDMNKICAICTNTLDPLKVALGIDLPEDSIKVHQVLESFSKFKYDEEYPGFLCSTCFSNTESAYKFQQMCNRSQLLFDNYKQQLTMLANIKTEIDIEETQIQIPPTSPINDNEDDLARLVVCDMCDRQIEFYNLQHHTKSEHEMDHVYHPCKLCDINFPTRVGLQKHMLVHTNEARYACEFCEKSFRLQETLAEHVTLHTEGKLHACDKCGKSCSDAFRLQKHLETHTSKLPYQCGKCDKSYARERGLRRHMTVVHTSDWHKCEFCGRRFGQKETLDYHRKLHEEGKLYVCNICGQSCIDAPTLKSHLDTHDTVQDDASEQIKTKERPLQCKICDKTFAQSHGLQKHMIVHTDAAPYSCEYCAKRFRYRETLFYHRKLHTERKLNFKTAFDYDIDDVDLVDIVDDVDFGGD